MNNFICFLGVKGGPAIRPGSQMPTSTLLRLADRNIVVDCGLGVSRGLCGQGLSLTDVDVIVITHLHSDHYLELGPLLHTAWTAGLKKTVKVFGPEGLENYWHHFCASMQFDIDLRIADEGRNDIRELINISVLNEGKIAVAPGISLSAIRNVHPPIEESFSLKFTTQDHQVVISGDTAPFQEMVNFAFGADVLVHEAMLVEGVEDLVSATPNGDQRLRHHILRSHSDAVEVGRIANEAGVQRLALYHLLPDGLPGYGIKEWERAVRSHWKGPLYIGQDGLAIEF